MRVVAVCVLSSLVATFVSAEPKDTPRSPDLCDTDFDPSGKYDLLLTSIPFSTPGSIPQCHSFPTGRKLRFRYEVAADLKADTVRIRNIDDEHAVIRDAKLGREISEKCKQRGAKTPRVRAFTWAEYASADEKEGLTFLTKGVGAGNAAMADVPKMLAIIVLLQDRKGQPLCYGNFINADP
jgi:hypothetical protein